MRDLMIALKAVAIGTTEIFELVGNRVYTNEIPIEDVEAADTRHPPKMLVLRQAGGAAKQDLLPIMDPVINALCYGETDEEADKVFRAVYQRFNFLMREMHEEVLIHHINPTGGPTPSTEPDFVWPVIAQGFTVKADLMEVAFNG